MKISEIIDDRERLRELYEERRNRVKVLEKQVKLLNKENKELKQVLNDIVNTIHEHIEIKIGE